MTDLAPRPTLTRIIVSVTQLDRALPFYQDHLGLTLKHRATPFAWLHTADQVEVMLHERPTQPSDTSVALGLTVQHLDHMVQTWASAGGQVIDPPAAQPWGEYMAVLRDSDGHLVCVSQRA